MRQHRVLFVVAPWMPLTLALSERVSVPLTTLVNDVDYIKVVGNPLMPPARLVNLASGNEGTMPDAARVCERRGR